MRCLKTKETTGAKTFRKGGWQQLFRSDDETEDGADGADGADPAAEVAEGETGAPPSPLPRSAHTVPLLGPRCRAVRIPLLGPCIHVLLLGPCCRAARGHGCR